MRFVYVDSFGLEWDIDLDGSLLVPGLPPWPVSDGKFLELCGISTDEEVEDGEF
jgi:hypothetical protein